MSHSLLNNCQFFPSETKEFIIAHGTIVTGAFLPVRKNAAIHVKNSKIISMNESSVLLKEHPSLPVVDATGMLLIPGLFNTHTHVALAFFRGLGHGKEDMIEKFLFPAEKSLTPELLEPLSYSYIFDGLKSGVTSFVDHYYFSEGIGRAFESMGARGWIGETVADLGGAFPGRESWERAKHLIENSKFGPLVRHVISPHAADTVSPQLMKECADYARAKNLPIHMHLAQTKGEFDRVQKREGLTPVESVHKSGALGQNSLVVHLTNATSNDLQLIQSTGATIGYCPTSTVIYDKLASIKEFYGLNIPMALGTDCAASNDSADILAEAKIAGVIARSHGVKISELTPDHLLAMATTIPAKVLGVENELGTLEVGKLADICFLKTSLSSEPIDEVLANIIYSMGSRDVSHVMVHGKFVIWNGAPTLLNESDMRQKFKAAVSEIRRRIASKNN